MCVLNANAHFVVTPHLFLIQLLTSNLNALTVPSHDVINCQNKYPLFFINVFDVLRKNHKCVYCCITVCLILLEALVCSSSRTLESFPMSIFV